MADEEFSVGIKAAFGDFLSNLNTLTGNVQHQAKEMSESFGKVGEAVEGVRGMLLGFTAILAGGAVFSESISAATGFTTAVNDLRQKLGGTTEAASATKVALDDVGISTQTYESAVMRLSRQIKTHSADLEKMGLSLRDNQGHLKPMNELMTEAEVVLGKYTEGTARNIAMQSLFGRGTGFSYDALVRFNDAQKEAKERTAELGLTVGQDSVNAMYAYQKSVNEAKTGIEAFEIHIGQRMMPILKDMADWFNVAAPDALKTFDGWLEGTAENLVYLGAGFKDLSAIGSTSLSLLEEGGAGLGRVMYDVAHGDWANLKNDFIDTGAKAREMWAKTADEVDANVVKMNAAIQKLKDGFKDLNLKSHSIGGGGSSGGNDNPPVSGGHGPSAFELFKAELDRKKEAHDQYFKDDLASDLAYWQSKLNLAGNAQKDNLQIESQIFATKKAMAQQALADDLAGIKIQMEAAKGQYDTRIALAVEASQKIAAAYGYESSQYKMAVREVVAQAEAQAAHQEKLREEEISRTQQHNSVMLSMQEEHARSLNAMQITDDQDYLTQQRQFANQQFQIDLDALNAKLANLNKLEDAYRKTLDDIAALTDKHNADMAKYDDQAVEQHIKKIEGLLAPINSAVAQSVQGMIQGTTTAQKALANIGQSILADFIKIEVSKLTHFVAVQLGMTAAATASETARAAIKTAAATAGAAAENAAGLASIGRDASKAAAGAYAAVAGIPIVGPVLAPIAAGVAFAAVTAYESGFGSAKDGWDIPSGINPMAQLHAREMVLPAEQADVIRSMAGGGGAGAVHYHDHSGTATPEQLRRNAKVIVEILNNEVRGFRFRPA